MSTTVAVPFDAGTWTAPPERVERAGDDLVVTARAGSDAWRRTYYGFERDSAHALVVDADVPGAYEVTFTLGFRGQYEQAGVFLAGPEGWLKAGVEVTDGEPHAAVVVTGPAGSDWSVSPVGDWAGSDVTVRVSLDRDAALVRARRDDGPWRFLRLAPLPSTSTGPLRVGPYLAAPEGPGLAVTFRRFAAGPADPGLHEGPA